MLQLTLVRGFQSSPKSDLNADFFVSTIRNLELGCLLRGGVASCIAGLLLRDAEPLTESLGLFELLELLVSTQ